MLGGGDERNTWSDPAREEGKFAPGAQASDISQSSHVVAALSVSVIFQRFVCRGRVLAEHNNDCTKLRPDLDDNNTAYTLLCLYVRRGIVGLYSCWILIDRACTMHSMKFQPVGRMLNSGPLEYLLCTAHHNREHQTQLASYTWLHILPLRAYWFQIHNFVSLPKLTVCVLQRGAVVQGASGKKKEQEN